GWIHHRLSLGVRLVAWHTCSRARCTVGGSFHQRSDRYEGGRLMGIPWVVVLVTVGIIVLSAFFVIMEFALLGARRHRLEDAALTSRSARAALWGIDQLTVMMAAAQL